MAATRRALRKKKRLRARTQRKRKHVGVKRTMKSKKSRKGQKRSVRSGTKKQPKIGRLRMRMTRDAWGMLHSFVDGIYKKVSGEAERLRRKGGRSSILPQDVQSALKQVMPRKYVRLVAYGKSR